MSPSPPTKTSTELPKTRRPTLRLIAPKEVDPLEAIHQEYLFSLVESWKPRCGDLAKLFAIPNGGWRHKATAAALQRQGVKSGVPDLELPVPRALFHGLWIELKRFREGEVSDAQAKRLVELEADGYRALVCWGWRAAWEEICEYLGISEEVLGRPDVSTLRRAPGGWLERKEVKKR